MNRIRWRIVAVLASVAVAVSLWNLWNARDDLADRIVLTVLACMFAPRLALTFIHGEDRT